MIALHDVVTFVRHVIDTRQLERELDSLRVDSARLVAENEKLKAQVEQVKPKVDCEDQAQQEYHPAGESNRLERLNYDPYKGLPR